MPRFSRYSPALKSADVVWGDETLDPWIADPKAFIPGNHMVFPGQPNEQVRADIIAFLKQATQAGQTVPQMEGMMGMGADEPNLNSVPESSQVKEIKYCGDTYSVTTADGKTAQGECRMPVPPLSKDEMALVKKAMNAVGEPGKPNAETRSGMVKAS